MSRYCTLTESRREKKEWRRGREKRIREQEKRGRGELEVERKKLRERMERVFYY